MQDLDLKYRLAPMDVGSITSGGQDKDSQKSRMSMSNYPDQVSAQGEAKQQLGNIESYESQYHKYQNNQVGAGYEQGNQVGDKMNTSSEKDLNELGLPKELGSQPDVTNTLTTTVPPLNMSPPSDQTPQDDKTFPRFKELPIEIRRKIWLEAWRSRLRGTDQTTMAGALFNGRRYLEVCKEMRLKKAKDSF